ncbi:DUF5683 domain-containing protein [soil metagenome]
MRISLSILFLTLTLGLHARMQFGFRVGQETQFIFSKDTNKTDTLRKKMAPPKKAAILSACLPGLGQTYNHYALGVRWSMLKIPFIYAGFGGLAYGFFWNQGFVKDYRNALRLRYDDDPNTTDQFSRYSDNDLVTLKDYYQRYRDLCVIGMAAVYTLQIIDAAVDAHLSTFDISDDLSMRIKPGFYPTSNGVVGVMGISLSFK